MNVEIVTHAVGGGSVIVDGKDISKAVRAFAIYAEAGEVTRIEVDLVVIDTTKLNSQVREIHIPKDTADGLQAIGWTPPPAVTSPPDD